MKRFIQESDNAATKRDIESLVAGEVITKEIHQELTYAHDGDLERACKEALKQIEYTRYEDDLEDDGVENILKYGIACYKKRCKVMLAENG